MSIAMLAMTALLAQGAPAAAAQAKAPPAKSAQAARFDASDIVCHKEYQLGSKIPTKVCRSKSEDEANRAESRQTLERLQNQKGFRQ